MIKIVARMLVKEGMVEQFKKTAEELVKKSQAEEGCIFYSLNVSVNNPRLLAFVENWKDQDAINIHNNTEHFKTILPQLTAMCEEGYPADFLTEVEY